MQLLGVGRQTSGWLNKNPDRLCRARLGEGSLSPFPFARLLLPLCAVVDTGLLQEGGKKMERPGGDREQITQSVPCFPSWYLHQDSVVALQSHGKE